MKISGVSHGPDSRDFSRVPPPSHVTSVPPPQQIPPNRAPNPDQFHQQQVALQRFSDGNFTEAMELFESCVIDPRLVIVYFIIYQVFNEFKSLIISLKKEEELLKEFQQNLSFLEES